MKELWKPELFKEYKAAKEAEQRAKMAESGRYVSLKVQSHRILHFILESINLT